MNYKIIVGVYGEWEDVKDDEDYTACSMWIEPDKVDYKCEPHWAHFEPYHKDIHLMQYTGLKDKNGKEIYEGDVLSTIKYDDKKAVGVIKYGKFNCSCCDGVYGWYIDTYDDFCLDIRDFNWGHTAIEVIGNIYENPDLLEE